MNTFLAHIPPDFPIEWDGYCNMPVYRLTLINGDQFYPVNFHGNLAAWRKRMSDSAHILWHEDRTVPARQIRPVGRAKDQSLILGIASLFAKDPYPPDW